MVRGPRRSVGRAAVRQSPRLRQSFCGRLRRTTWSPTISSYVNWVGANRNFAMLVADVDNPPSDPKTQFDRLYCASTIVQFGRTAKFDFLTMIGKLDIADIEPPLPYLQGATGPILGAKLLIANDPQARIRSAILSDTVVALGDSLGVGMQVMEDLLWDWQKSQFKYLPFRG